MAENNENDDTSDIEDDDTPPKKGKKGLIIIIVILLALAGGGAGLYFSGMLDSLFGGGDKKAEKTEDGTTADSKEDASKDGKDEKAKDMSNVQYHTLPEVITNLAPGAASETFLKIQVVLEVPNPEVLEKVKKAEPKIKDIINVYVRDLRANDMKGSAGAYRLREELLLRINKTLYPDAINNILFTTLTIQ